MNKNSVVRILVFTIAGVAIFVFGCFFGFLLNGSEANSQAPDRTSTLATSTDKPALAEDTHVPPTKTPRPTRTPRPTSTPEYGTMENPIRFGEHAYLVWDDASEFSVSIVSVVRGQEALDIVLNENPFNETPPEGMEYIVFVAEIEHTGDDSEILEIDDFFWGVLSKGRVFDWTLSVCCFEGVKLARGGVADETVALQVYVDDENPLLIFGEKFYFSTR